MAIVTSHDNGKTLTKSNNENELLLINMSQVIFTVWCKMQSGSFQFLFQQFCLFCLYCESYCHGSRDTQNRKRKQKNHEQATNPKDTQHAHSMAAPQYAPEMLCQATAADSGGRASKRGNGVKKQGAGRISPALMEERANSASKLMSEPRTIKRAGGRGATVAGNLVIYWGSSLTAGLGNSCDFGSQVHLSFLLHNPIWNHSATYGRKH